MAVILVAIFWLGSRYPDLDQKAMMAGDAQFSAIGFDLLVHMPPDPSVLLEVAVNAVNWGYTNWKGMTFGLLAGALLLTMLPHLQRLSFQSRTANSALGLAVGAPLGVCVNCATPVAQGALAGGSRPETALAMMVSSPTLNVIVVTMVLSLFPIHIALTKIVLTFVFILGVIPLLVRFFPVTARASLQDLPQAPSRFATWIQAPVPADPPRAGWLGSALFVAREALRNLGYLGAVTVPLMILAGNLGAAVVTLLPFDLLHGLLPRTGDVVVLAAMVLLVLFALTLPSPMTFDVIVAAVLLNAGLGAGYVMVMIFGLGIFSVYPFLLIWRQMSRQMALAMLVSLAGLGVAGGGFVHLYHPYYAEARDAEVQALMAEVDAPTERPVFTRPEAARSADALVAALQSTPLSRDTLLTNDTLTLERQLFQTPSIGGPTQFTRLDGSEIGFTESDGQSYLRFFNPMFQVRAVASGDLHNDGWPDLVFGDTHGFAVYANTQDGQFERQDVPLPEVDTWSIGAVALIDLTNDGWLDLVFSTWDEGLWLIENDAGVLRADSLTQLPNTPGAIMPTVLAFEDTNGDGHLDIFVGNTGYGDDRGAGITSPLSRNALLMGGPDGFERIDLDGVVAETLSALFVDLNQDGTPDLMVGNDFRAGDIIYLNDGDGGLRLLEDPTEILPMGGTTTMAIIAGDIDNDLVPEVFLGQKAWERSSVGELPPQQACAEIPDATARLSCERHLEGNLRIIEASRSGNLDDCARWPFPDEQADCLALELLRRVDRATVTLEDCAQFTPGWPLLARICEHYPTMNAIPSELQTRSQLPSVMRRNLLFQHGADGAWTETADAFGIEDGGWVWNSRFADLDQDTFQDLFLVTGVPSVRLRHPTYYYRNTGGTGFENQTAEAGLLSHLDIASYTYVDYDADGDLDIIAAPLLGTVFVLRNDGPRGNAIMIDLRDAAGNLSAIGARITLTTPDGGQQMRDVMASGGYMSHDALTAHFGLGANAEVTAVTVTWPDGETTDLSTPLEAGARYTLTRHCAAE